MARHCRRGRQAERALQHAWGSCRPGHDGAGARPPLWLAPLSEDASHCARVPLRKDIEKVKSVRSCAKHLIERLAGIELQRLGRKSMLIADTAKPEEAWYSLRATLCWILQRQRVNHVIDVGANTGQFGQFMRSNGSCRRLVSFGMLG